jgi:hypothetical protein
MKIVSAFSAYLRVLCVNRNSNAEDAEERRERGESSTLPIPSISLFQRQE